MNVKKLSITNVVVTACCSLTSMTLFIFLLWKSWGQEQRLIRTLSALFMIALVSDLARAICLHDYTLYCVSIKKEKDGDDCKVNYRFSGPYTVAINWLFTVFLISNQVAYWLFSFKYFVIAQQVKCLTTNFDNSGYQFHINCAYYSGIVVCVLAPLLYGSAPASIFWLWETGIFISYTMTLASISLLAKSIYDIRQALIKRPGTVFNTKNVLRHLICFFLVFLTCTVLIVQLVGDSAGINSQEKPAEWFFRGQITFEVFYFVSTVFLIKIFNEIVNLCVKTTIQNVDSDSDDADDLSQEQSLASPRISPKSSLNPSSNRLLIQDRSSLNSQQKEHHSKHLTRPLSKGDSIETSFRLSLDKSLIQPSAPKLQSQIDSAVLHGIVSNGERSFEFDKFY